MLKIHLSIDVARRISELLGELKGSQLGDVHIVFGRACLDAAKAHDAEMAATAKPSNAAPPLPGEAPTPDRHARRAAKAK